MIVVIMNSRVVTSLNHGFPGCMSQNCGSTLRTLDITAMCSCTAASAVVLISSHWTLKAMIWTTDFRTAITTVCKVQSLWEFFERGNIGAGQRLCRLHGLGLCFPISLSFSLSYTHTSPCVTVMAFPEPEQAVPAQSRVSDTPHAHCEMFCLLLTALIEHSGELWQEKNMFQSCAFDCFKSLLPIAFAYITEDGMTCLWELDLLCSGHFDPTQLRCFPMRGQEELRK